MPSSTPRKPLLQLAEKKCSSRADARARDARAREVALRNYLRGIIDPYIQTPVPGTRCPRLTAITKAMA